MKPILISIVFFLFLVEGKSQNLIDLNIPQENIEHFVISNFAGNINVVHSAGKSIKLKAMLRKGELHPEVQIKHIIKEQFVRVYYETPCNKSLSVDQFDPENPMINNVWGEDCKWDVDHEEIFTPVDFRIEIPKGINVYLSTIMDGDIEVHKLSNDIWISNVNGSISCHEVDRVIQAKTVNGDIDIQYNHVPEIGSEYHTINGDIDVNMSPEADLFATFKSFQGDFYTDLEQVKQLPSEVVDKSEKHGFQFKVSEFSRIQIGDGGPELNFETFNGDVYLTTGKSLK